MDFHSPLPLPLPLPVMVGERLPGGGMVAVMMGEVEDEEEEEEENEEENSCRVGDGSLSVLKRLVRGFSGEGRRLEVRLTSVSSSLLLL